MKKLFLSCLVIACTILSARAAIVCIAPTSTTPGSFQVTSPIIFTIATAGTVVAFDLNGWVTSDGTNNTSPLSPALAYSFNSTTGSSPSVLHDNFTGTINNFGPNDGYIVITNNFSVSVGSTVTLAAGIYTLDPVSGFNPQATQTFTGNLYLTDNTGFRLSNIVSAVPEPPTWAALGLGLAGLGVVSLRRRCAARA